MYVHTIYIASLLYTCNDYAGILEYPHLYYNRLAIGLCSDHRIDVTINA